MPIQLAYKDTTGYFGIYLNKPSWWALRIVIEARTPWIGFNVSPETGMRLLPPAFSRLDPSPWAEFRIGVNGPEDLRACSELVIAAIQKTIDDRRSGRDAGAKAAVV